MDIKDAFRNLVTNQFMTEFNYRDRFKFETVFYRTVYSYVCCPCAFQHEFFTYISEDGTLDEAVYEAILGNIVYGRCNHVGQGIPDKWVTETSVSGLQVATALGTKQAERDNIERGQFAITSNPEGIFQLSLHNIALIRRKYENLAWYLRHYFTNEKLLNFVDNDYFCHRPNKAQNIFEVKKITVIETLVQTRNIGVIRDVLMSKTRFENDGDIFYISLMKAFEYTLKHRLEDITTELVEYTKFFGPDPLRMYLMVAIVYNRPEILDCLLQIIPNSEISAKEIIKRMLCITCEVLKRKECTGVLLKHNIKFETDNATGEQRVEVLLGLVDDDNFYKDFEDEIIAALNAIQNVQHKCIASMSKKVNSIALNPNMVKTILESGSENFDQKFMTHALAHYSTKTRRILQFLIGANIETHDSIDTVEAGLITDLNRFVMWSPGIQKEGVYCTDIKERDVVTNKDYNLPMNFIGPLLLECGFRTSQHALTKYLNKFSSLEVQNAGCIRRYLQCYLENPKRLAVITRETIRRYYKGRSLHTYLCSINCPDKIKDFISLKHLFEPEMTLETILNDMDIYN